MNSNLKKLWLFAFLFSSSLISAYFLFGKDSKKMYLLSECWIYDSKGAVIKIVNQDQQCLLLKNGETISFNHKFLSRTNSRGEIVWKKPGYYHHSIQLLKNQKEFVVLNSEPDNETKKIRISRIEKFNLDGDLVGFWTYNGAIDDFFGFLERKKEKVATSAEVREMYPFDYEYEHMNYIQEIPKNPLSKINPAFREGNFLVGFGYIINRIAIFDKDTLKPVWFLKFPDDQFVGGFHSPQLLESGKIILYLNYGYPNNNSVPRTDLKSSIIEIDPLTSKTNVIFPLQDNGFYMHVDGGVTVIDGNEYLLNGEIDKKYLVLRVDHEGRIVWQFSHFRRSQEVRFEDLSSYLENVSF